MPAAPEPPRFGPEAKAARRALAAAEALKDNKEKVSISQSPHSASLFAHTRLTLFLIQSGEQDR